MAKSDADRLAAAKAAQLKQLEEEASTPDTPTELVVVPNGATALAAESPDLSRELTSEDFRLPQLKIGQAMSSAVANEIVKAGRYYLSLGNVELGTQVKVVVATMFKSRSFFAEGKLLCRSYNMTQGIGTPGIKCFECPLREWSGEGNKRVPPQCKENYNYGVVILPEDPDIPMTTAILRLGGTSAPAGKDLNGLVLQRSARMERDPITNIPRPVPEWSKYSFVLGTDRRQMSSGAGVYYVATVSLGEKVDPESQEAMKAETLALTLSPQRLAASVEADDTND